MTAKNSTKQVRVLPPEEAENPFEVAKKASPMEITLSNLEGSVSVLFSEFDALRSRLVPVLIEQKGSDSKEAECEYSDNMSPMQCRIQDLSNRIELLTNYVRGTTSSLSI